MMLLMKLNKTLENNRIFDKIVRISIIILLALIGFESYLYLNIKVSRKYEIEPILYADDTPTEYDLMEIEKYYQRELFLKNVIKITIAIFVVLFCIYILMPINQNIKKIAITIVIILSLAYCLLKVNNNINFDSQVWKKWKESETKLSFRNSMMNDLRNNYLLKGKTKSQIINLLGTPESQTRKRFYYYLEYSEDRINTKTFIIIFNDDNIVEDSEETYIFNKNRNDITPPSK